jgi:hypothetical protein
MGEGLTLDQPAPLPPNLAALALAEREEARAALLLLPAFRGEKVGMRGCFPQLAMRAIRAPCPSPGWLRNPTSSRTRPQAGRSEG